MSDPVTEFLRLAESLEDHELLERTERFLREQQSDLNTLAVLEKRPDDQPVALLKIADGEATLFSVRQSEGRSLIHETYIGRSTAPPSHRSTRSRTPSEPKEWKIVGSRLGGTISPEYYTIEEQEALMEALREVVAPRS